MHQKFNDVPILKTHSCGKDGGSAGIADFEIESAQRSS